MPPTINNDTTSEKDLEYKIEIASQTLERNICFNVNCDNKTSIVLAAFGVFLAILLTKEGLNEIFHIIKACITAWTCWNMLYLFAFACSILILTTGLFNLGSVLLAKTSEDAIGRADPNSRIFFAGIKKSGDFNSYRQKFYAMSKEDLLNDLLEQIYINSDIATGKYKKYNKGLKWTTIGFTILVSLFFVGICIY